MYIGLNNFDPLSAYNFFYLVLKCKNYWVYLEYNTNKFSTNNGFVVVVLH